MAKFNSLGNRPQALFDQHNSCLCKLNICSKNNLVYRTIGPWPALGLVLCPGTRPVLCYIAAVFNYTKMRKQTCQFMTVRYDGELHNIAQTNLDHIQTSFAKTEKLFIAKMRSCGPEGTGGRIVFLFSCETEEEICFCWSIISTLKYLS
jgi:hypothetical protein